MNETTAITTIYIGFLIFVGWVFVTTTSPWAFALLAFTPTIKWDKNSKKENKKIENTSNRKLSKNE